MKKLIYLNFILVSIFFSSATLAITPQGWTINAKENSKCEVLPDGTLSISGNLENGVSTFISNPIDAPNDKIYTLLFSVRGDSKSGAILAGTRYINKDISQTEEAGFVDEKVRIAPTNNQIKVKLGAWNTGNSTIKFKNMRIVEYLPLYENDRIGEAETIKNGEYVYQSIFAMGYPISPMPENNNTTFNTQRWSMSSDASLIFTFGNKKFTQLDGKIQINIGYNPSKINLLMYASADGKPYEYIGKVGADFGGEIKLAENLFPAKVVKVKLVLEDKKCVIQFDSLRYSAKIKDKKLDLSTRLIGSADVSIVDGMNVSKKSWKANSRKIKITSKTPFPRDVKVDFSVETMNEVFSNLQKNITLSDDAKTLELNLPQKLSTLISLKISIPQRNWTLDYSAEKSNFTLVEEDFTGNLLPVEIGNMSVWQTSSANKLAQTCKPPTQTTNIIELSCAGNECETLQLAFKKSSKGKIKFDISDLKNGDNIISAKNIKPYLLDYVKISMCTDNFSKRAMWPDPIIELPQKEFEIDAKKVQPLWIKFIIPENTPAGIYEGKITISIGDETAIVPIKLRIFGFSLPQKPTLRSGFGESVFKISRFYNNPNKVRDRLSQEIREIFAEAKIFPYNALMANPKFKFVYPDNDKTKTPKVVFDWTDFDKNVSEQIEKYNVGAMCIKIQGIGSGNFRREIKGKINEIVDGDPRYEAVLADYLGQIDKHIVEKGWIDFFYSYTFDEPEKHNYPFLIKELSKIKKYAPHINVMITEEPSQELTKVVDIWCPITREFSHKDALQAQKDGDEVWWYICTNPRAPFAGLFIDHAGVDLRVWLWQTFKYDVEGILIWATTYMYSTTAYPNSLQNPYADPMSWADVYVLPKGTKRNWGNGDGRFFYPPASTKDGKKAGDNDKFVSTMRMDILRDGIEDYEYLHILKRTLAKKSAKLSKEEQKKYAELLAIPETITKSMTDFSFNPMHIEKRRLQIAEAIEELLKK